MPTPVTLTTPTLRSLLALLAIIGFALPTHSAWAKKDGVSGYSGRFGATCSSCHAAGPAPVVAPTPAVSLTGPTSVGASTTSRYTVTISGGIPLTGDGGFNVAATAGQLIVATPNETQLLNNEIAHKPIVPVGVKVMDAAGTAFWVFDWQAPATNGTYTLYAAGLSGNGDFGFYGDAVGTATLNITVAGGAAQAPTAVHGGPYSGQTGTPVQFNGSGSFDGDGVVVSYTWNFGDGTTGSGATPTHTYTSNGVYTVTLTVTDNSGLTGSASTTVNIGSGTPPPPVYDGQALYGTNCSGCHGQHSGTSTSTKAGRSAAAIQNAINSNTGGMGGLSFLVPGEVQAIADFLAAPPPGGGTPTPQPPTANAGGPYSGVVGTPVQFNGTGSFDSDGTVNSYAWNFGDGTTGTGGTPTHTYTATGTYTVTLTVTDNSGLTGSQQTTVSIGSSTPPPPPPPDGAALYGSNCQTCHGPLATSSKRGRSGSQIQNAINSNTGGMGTTTLRALTVAQINAIATALGGSPNAGTPTPQPPTANAGGPYTGVVGTPVQFNGTGSLDPDGTISSYAWTFGDGTTGSGPTPTRTYTAAGTYTVTLTVTDNSGQTGSQQTTASIGTSTPPPPDGAALYTSNCQSCHGQLATSTKRGRSGSQIQNAINSNTGGMGSLSSLTVAQINAIATALGGTPDAGTTPPPPPPPTGTDGATLYGQYCAGCHQPLANSTKRGRSGAQIKSAITAVSSMNSLSNLTDAQINAIATALGGTPNAGTAPPVTRGQALYDANCLGCHGAGGSGGPAGSVRGESASSIRNAINEESEMRFLSTLSSTDIQDIANYLSGSGSTSPTSGEGLYNSYCAGCHGPTGRGGPAGDVRGASTDKIKSAIREERDMRYLSGMLTDSQIRLISTYLRSFGGGDD